MNKNEVIDYIDDQKETIENLSDKVWDFSETAFEEYKSADEIIRVLKEYNFNVERNLAGIATAFSGSFGSGYPKIGILGEFDALSGLCQEAGSYEKKADSSCNSGNGQGCGHNLLGAGSLAAAIGVKKYLEENNLEGEIIYYGCPGEEGGSGKTFMARDGVFDDLDAALSWHPGNFNMVWTGSTLGNYQVYYRFKGVSSHAAADPESGRSALDAVTLMNLGTEFLREHISSKARIHYAITNSGGFSPNVVPANAEVLYLMRAPKNHELEDIYERVNNIAKGAALMTGTEVEIDFVKACSGLVPNQVIEKVLYKNMLEVGYPKLTDDDKQYMQKFADTIDVEEDELELFKNFAKSEEERAFLNSYIDKAYNDFIPPYFSTNMTMPGSTDVGDVSRICPTSQIMVTTLASNTPGHSWQIVAQGKGEVAHKGMMYAAKVLALSAIDLFEDIKKIDDAKAELKNKLGAKGYINPIPKDVKPRVISN